MSAARVPAGVTLVNADLGGGRRSSLRLQGMYIEALKRGTRDPDSG